MDLKSVGKEFQSVPLSHSMLHHPLCVCAGVKGEEEKTLVATCIDSRSNIDQLLLKDVLVFDSVLSPVGVLSKWTLFCKQPPNAMYNDKCPILA